MAEVVVGLGTGEAQISYLKEIKKPGFRRLCADGNREAAKFGMADLPTRARRAVDAMGMYR